MGIDRVQAKLVPGKALVHRVTGEKVGDALEVFLDPTTDEPTWVLTRTGLLGTAPRFVPLDDAELQGDVVTVPYDKNLIKDAPDIGEASTAPSAEQAMRLHEHYGIARRS